MRRANKVPSYVDIMNVKIGKATVQVTINDICSKKPASARAKPPPEKLELIIMKKSPVIQIPKTPLKMDKTWLSLYSRILRTI